MTALLALLLLALAPGAAVPAGATDLVAEGERWWTVSPDPGNPVACATCHYDPAAVRGWAASFPKVKPLPRPHTRVMTLLQVNAEAVARHYRLVNPRPAATAITAYLAALGSDVRISPGIAAGQPVFPERMRQLRASVRHGAALYGRRCRVCHHESEVAGFVRGFPRVRSGAAESLESFLEAHHPRAEPLGWDGQPMADLIAYLASRLAEQEEIQ